MRSVTAKTTVHRPREEVFAFLDVAANHETFNDHFMHDWQFAGPPTGVGARTTATTDAGGMTDQVEIEVTEVDQPALIVERNVGAGGSRIGVGTYRLSEVAEAATEVEFTYAWQRAPLLERAAAPIVRLVMRRALTTSMSRLADALEDRRCR